jgi:hypothetical protein
MKTNICKSTHVLNKRESVATTSFCPLCGSRLGYISGYVVCLGRNFCLYEKQVIPAVDGDSKPPLYNMGVASGFTGGGL